jgi:hypothetical protein
VIAERIRAAVALFLHAAVAAVVGLAIGAILPITAAPPAMEATK